jgi:hypothetical protein
MGQRDHDIRLQVRVGTRWDRDHDIKLKVMSGGMVRQGSGKDTDHDIIKTVDQMLFLFLPVVQQLLTTDL